MNCPYCDYEMEEPEFVNVGVGFIQVTAYGCERCHAIEIGAHRDRKLNPWEIYTGFYEPDEMVGVVGFEPTTS